MATKTLSILSVKNIQFTRVLKSEGILREFNFRKGMIEGRIVFHVDVTDDRGNRIMFSMEKRDANWKIQSRELLPSWVTRAEADLHALVEEEYVEQRFAK